MVTTGLSDTSIKNHYEDKFSLEPYVKSLTSFIRECETPMSIAIQGDWGCGKTSFMNLIEESLDATTSDFETFTFNTWQFSQFNSADMLPLIFLSQLCNTLSEKVDNKQKVSNLKRVVNFLDKSYKFAKIAITNKYFGDAAAENLKDNDDLSDTATAMVELKSSFKETITAINKKVVIFIDDLDRLQPIRAIELLEILKVFLDCENCIFILAIDTSVVFQGLKAKYGDDLSIDKQRSFFDKLIQLPFQVPVQSYNFKDYLEAVLPNSFYNEIQQHPNDIESIYTLLKEAAYNNPRCIKRITNAYTLNSNVLENKGLMIQNNDLPYLSRKILFTMICFQSRFPTEYEDFLYKLNNINFAPNIYSILNNTTTPKSVDTYTSQILRHRSLTMGTQLSGDELRQMQLDDSLNTIIDVLRKNYLKIKDVLGAARSEEYFNNLVYLSSSTSNEQYTNLSEGTQEPTAEQSLTIEDVKSSIKHEFGKYIIESPTSTPDSYYFEILPNQKFHLIFISKQIVKIGSTEELFKELTMIDGLLEILNNLNPSMDFYNKVNNAGKILVRIYNEKLTEYRNKFKMHLAEYHIQQYSNYRIDSVPLSAAQPVLKSYINSLLELRSIYPNPEKAIDLAHNDDTISTEEDTIHIDTDATRRQMNAMLDELSQSLSSPSI